MKTNSILRLALAIVLAGAVGSAAAQESHRAAAQTQPSRVEPHEGGKGVLRLLPADSVTEHSIDTPKGKLAYTATAGTLAFYDQSGDQSAAVFYTAYVAKVPKDLGAGTNRPLTFVFNGGPGAASAFLHLGLVGPRILDLGPNGRDAATAQLRDNPDTWLAFTDLVLIDPIGTGWSRTVKPDDGKHFWNIRADADSIAKAIALYVAKNDRAGSPKYLFGESYGGFRAAKVARALQRDQGIMISGIVMLSPMLQGWLTFGDDESALRAALQLPSLTAAELERKNAFTLAALAEAEKFAMTDYLTTMAGAPPQGAAGKAFYARVAQITGLPVDVVTQARGFVENAFVKNLRADGKIVSRYDANFAVDDPYPELRSAHGPDPILDSVTRAYGGAMAAYARNELGFKTEMTYALLASQVTSGWDWQGGRLQASAEDDLRTLLAFGPTFRLLIAHGVSDMITPYGMTRYVLDHLPPVASGRAQLKLYRGGHMLYLEAPSRKAFSADAAAFYRAAGE
jgi:carboxypeptidase C (cathepsin A)